MMIKPHETQPRCMLAMPSNGTSKMNSSAMNGITSNWKNTNRHKPCKPKRAMKTKQRTTPFLNPHGKTMNRIGYESKPKMRCWKSCFPTWSNNQIFERLDFQMLNHPWTIISHNKASHRTPLCYILDFSGWAWFGNYSEVATLIL